MPRRLSGLPRRLVGVAVLAVAPVQPTGAAADGLPARHAAAFGDVRVEPAYRATAIREGLAARAAARTVLGLPAARFDIVAYRPTGPRWGDRNAAGAPIYSWRFAAEPGAAIAPPAHLLRHEIGHDLFIRYLVPDTRRGQYGGDAPDWLDEMAAVAFEDDDLRAARRRAMASRTGQSPPIPLARFLTMPHPELATNNLSASADGAARAFEPASRDTASFYAMAAAFYEFLVARTGTPAIVARMAEVVRSGQPLDRWLIVRTGHGRSQDGMAALSADFARWLATDPRYGGAA